MKKNLLIVMFIITGVSFANIDKNEIINPKIELNKKKIKSVKRQGDLNGYCFKVQQDVKETYTSVYPNDPDFVNALALGAYMGCMRN